MALYGGIEAGGTKFVCAVAEAPDAPPAASVTIPTTTPDATLELVQAFFKPYELHALGIASFGPVDLRAASSTYGYITETPKPGWKYTDLAGRLHRALGVPVGFDTDVNAAALAEWRYGAGRGLDTVVYITVGTGFGGGGVVDGRMIHGLIHPEMGHLMVRRHPDDSYPGHCPFHRDCLEGMVCGPALIDRWGAEMSALPEDHRAWEFEAYYLAQAVCAILYILSPQRIIFGGGVMQQRHLFTRIHALVPQMLNGYLHTPEILQNISALIVPPGLAERSGAVGALELGRLALADR